MSTLDHLLNGQATRYATIRGRIVEYTYQLGQAASAAEVDEIEDRIEQLGRSLNQPQFGYISQNIYEALVAERDTYLRSGWGEQVQLCNEIIDLYRERLGLPAEVRPVLEVF